MIRALILLGISASVGFVALVVLLACIHYAHIAIVMLRD